MDKGGKGGKDKGDKSGKGKDKGGKGDKDGKLVSVDAYRRLAISDHALFVQLMQTREARAA
jgi:hypothetical protein